MPWQGLGLHKLHWRIAQAIAGGPLPFPDLFTTPQKVPVNGNLMDDNGFGADSDTDVGRVIFVKAETKTTAQGGQVVINSDGTFSYTPPDTFFGTDFFTYTLLDELLRSRDSTVTVIVKEIKFLTVAMTGGAVLWGTQPGKPFGFTFGKLLAPEFVGGGALDAAISLHLVDYQGSGQMTAALFLYGEMGVAYKGGGAISKFNPTYGVMVPMSGGGTFNCPGIFTAELSAPFTGGATAVLPLVDPYFEMGVSFNGGGNETSFQLTTEHDFSPSFVGGGALATSSAYQTAHPDEGDSLGLQAYQNLPTALTGSGLIDLTGLKIGLEGLAMTGSGTCNVPGVTHATLTVGLDGGGLVFIWGTQSIGGSGSDFDPQHFVGGGAMTAVVERDLGLIPMTGGGTMSDVALTATNLNVPIVGGGNVALTLQHYVEVGSAIVGSGNVTALTLSALPPAVKFGSAQHASGSASAYAFTVNCEAPIMIVAVAMANTAGGHIVSVVLGGVTMTEVPGSFNFNPGMALFAASGVPTGNQTCTVNLGAATGDCYVASWSGVGLTSATPDGQQAVNAGSGTLSITGISGGSGIVGLCGGSTLSGTGVVVDATIAFASRSFIVGHTTPLPGTTWSPSWSNGSTSTEIVGATFH